MSFSRPARWDAIVIGTGFFGGAPVACRLAEAAAQALNIVARVRHLKSFHRLGQEERESVLRWLEVKFPFFVLLTRMIRAPFYGADYAALGTDYMSWPGANQGYVNDPTFSFGVPMGRERTQDGIME